MPFEDAGAPNACQRRVLEKNESALKETLECYRSAIDDLTDCYENQCKTAEQIGACLLGASDIEDCPEPPASVTRALEECE